jgi:hypothetical protein
MSEPKIIDLNFMGLSLSILSVIASELERNGCVTVINCAMPTNGEGETSFQLGRAIGIMEAATK